MTGRDLIIYILENQLEDVSIFDEAFFSGFVTVEDAAKKLDSGVATVMALIRMEQLDAFETIDNIYIFPKSLEEYIRSKEAIINGGIYV